MCNIKNWFGSSKKKKAQAAAKKAKEQAEIAARKAQASTMQETATNAQTNKSNDKTITSLRVPLSTQGTGGNVDMNRRLGLNLYG